MIDAGRMTTPVPDNPKMNISRAEQRTLHALAQGGRILLERDDQGRIIAARCFTRDGWVLEGCDLSQCWTHATMAPRASFSSGCQKPRPDVRLSSWLRRRLRPSRLTT